jgi:glycine C-acetyltransferase
MRITGIPKENRAIYAHNNMAELDQCLKAVPASIKRVVVIFDGIFSMRGDFAPIDQIAKVCAEQESRFEQGIITVVDDSHGIGAYGKTGRGTMEHAGSVPDIVIGTFGKAFSVNGGFIAASETVIEAVRQRADTYIYTNPLSVADCAAAIKAIDICDSAEGRDRLANVQSRIKQFRDGLAQLGLESIAGPHPVVPVLVRDTGKTQRMVKHLYEKGVLAVGLTFPVVPKGSETIRFQINAAHTEGDIAQVLSALDTARKVQ